ncbi:MAG: hypothetical protein WCB75_02930, partial [Pseudolabrys sp.]
PERRLCKRRDLFGVAGIMPQPNDAQERDQGQRSNGALRMSATGDTIAMMRPDKAAFAAR